MNDQASGGGGVDITSSNLVRLAPEDAKRLDDIQKSLDAILREMRRPASQGVPVS